YSRITWPSRVAEIPISCARTIPLTPARAPPSPPDSRGDAARSPAVCAVFDQRASDVLDRRIPGAAARGRPRCGARRLATRRRRRRVRLCAHADRRAGGGGGGGPRPARAGGGGPPRRGGGAW